MTEIDQGAGASENVGPFCPAEGRCMIQFTVRWMLAVTAFAALIFAGLFAFPPVLSAALAFVLMFAAPGALGGCVVYGRPAWRAFAVGALIPEVVRLFGGGTPADPGSVLKASLWVAGPGDELLWESIEQSSFQAASAPAYFERINQILNSLGHVILAEEVVFLAASLIAGIASLVAWRVVGRRPIQTDRR